MQPLALGLCLLLLGAAAVHAQQQDGDLPPSATGGAPVQTAAPPSEDAPPDTAASSSVASPPPRASPQTPPGLPASSSTGSAPSDGSSGGCPAYIDTQRYRTTNFTDFLNTTVAISPRRPPANLPTGDWIQGRATFYGTDERTEASRVACGEPAGQFGIVAQGSCGYTNSDGSLPFPREVYAAAADTNEDYPGSCGRCYQVRCKTGPVSNNGRTLRMSDLIYARPYQVKDNFGRDWPGNPGLADDVFFAKCWDDTKAVTVRVSDSCPCQYPIKGADGKVQEVRTQNWCCGGNNHFDLSFWAFEQLAHPSYGVIPIEYRPVHCETGEPLRPIPGFISKTIFDDSIQPGWSWLPYNAKNTVLLAKGQGVAGSNATCATLSEGGAVEFKCRQCSRPGYQPFAKATALRFDIRSNTRSSDAFASSTPRGQLPPLKLFLMNADSETYCGAEVVLSASNTTAAGNSTLVPAAEFAEPLAGEEGWYRVSIPLSAWACDRGSVRNLTSVDRVDFQNINVREADICLDNIALV